MLFQNVFAVIDLYGCVDAVTVISSAFTEVFNTCSRPPSIPSLDGSELLEVRTDPLTHFPSDQVQAIRSDGPGVGVGVDCLGSPKIKIVAVGQGAPGFPRGVFL